MIVAAGQKPVLCRFFFQLAGIIVVLVFLLPTSLPAQSPVSSGADADTGLKYWEWNADGVQFRLSQRLPDQSRAFFMARGFDAENANEVAVSCIFQSMFRNTASEGEVQVDIGSWRVISDKGSSGLLTREHWSNIWKKRQLPAAAQIAFEWSLFPTRQTYAPGDYNWGMTSYGLPPGSRFSLEFTWRHGSKTGHGRLDNIECPPDVHPEPQS